ncbi:hypothetical protein LTR36_008788 [Oleoguttula mirabilis]|uniref:Protein SQS1 n=1 Tax=Oleoguttula mirabilis TaxID=1507867 RepID=A0AAV9J7T4_9PEZI|nr:hypothetical protein LTR36_008788 [Oleoguttula mirabilis]
MPKKGKGQGKPKGRAAQRGKAQKGSPRAGGWQQKFQFVDDTDDNPQRSFKGFSQANPRDLQQRTPNAKLRDQAISFISAAPNAPAKAEHERDFVEEAIAVAAEHNEEQEIMAAQSDYSLNGEEEFDELDNDSDGGMQTNIMTDADVEVSEGAMAQMHIQSTADATGPDTDGTSNVPEALPFFVDTAGDPGLMPRLKANGKRPVPRSPSPATSDSSEEVVVFHGRGRNPVTVNDPVLKPAGLPPHRKVQSPQRSPEPHITDGLLAALGVPTTPARPSAPTTSTSSATSVRPSAPAAPVRPSPPLAKGWANRPPAHQVEQQQASQTWQAAPSFPYWKKGKQRPDLDPSSAERAMLEGAPARSTKVMFVEPEKDAEETISSLLRPGAGQAQKGKDKLDDVDLGVNGSSRSNRRGKRGRKKDNRQMRKAIVSDDEDDEEAAYDDYMENLKAQLDGESGDVSAFTPVNATALAEAIAGPSLVVDGKEIAETELLEDEWEDSSSSESEGPIGQDLSDLSDDDAALNYSDMESSELEDELEYTEREQWEDEEDIRQRRVAAMDDEHLARLYAKQIELGIDSEDLIIDDGLQVDGAGDLGQAYAGLQDIANSSFSRSANKHGMRRSRRSNGDFSFPDASALADTVEQYGENGFDIMDFERPSLRPRKKGRKGKLPPELEAMSDEELKEEMTGMWENDRMKKSARKAEREELRAQGLLGGSGKKGKADLSQKYLEGMTTQQVYEELRIFLQDDGQNSRPFPPMEKKDRAALHVVADKLNLKSKSVGTAKNRFPVLYKTTHTLEYSEAHFNRLMQASTRGFLKNSASRGKKAGRGGWSTNTSRPGRGGGFDKTATSLRNGEVVGAGAAEIGRESMGHKLMEKMGWSKGMALGKEGEGMLMPVQQVMRAGKAGLG